MKAFKFSFFVLLAFLALVLAGCSQSEQDASIPTDDQQAEESAMNQDQTQAEDQVDQDNILEQIKETTYSGERVVIETKKGRMVLELYPDVAPIHVKNFVKLIRQKFYDGLTFHRVEPEFVIQGGDPRGTGAGGPGYTIPAEFNAKQHLRGTLAMARSQAPDSAGSQFYICLAPQPSLDGNYTVFGQVVEGIETIDQIAVGDVMDKVYLEPTAGVEDGQTENN